MKAKPKRRKVAEFLTLLSAATRETGIAVEGCGCCGSPFLVKLDGRAGRYKIDGKRMDCLTWKPKKEGLKK